MTIRGDNFSNGVKVIGPAGVYFDGLVRVNATSITATASTSMTAKRGTTKALTVLNGRSGGYGAVDFAPVSVN